MQGHFKISAQKSPAGQIYSGERPPFESFKIPEFINRFCQEVLSNTADRYFPVGQALLFGGAILDQKLGIKPKDYDIYLSCPALVETAGKILNDQDRRHAAAESMMDIVGDIFPLDLHDESISFDPIRTDLGKCLGVQGTYFSKGETHHIDITVGNALKTPEEFSRRSAAPILSCVASLHPGETEYAYHQDFEEHLNARVICTDDSRRKYFQKKADRKNLRLMTQDEWSAYKTVAFQAKPAPVRAPGPEL